MHESEVRVNHEIINFRRNYSAVFSANPVYSVSIDHIANIVFGCYSNRFFLQEFLQGEGEIILNSGRCYLSHTWDFSKTNQGIELARRLSSSLDFPLTMYAKECLELLFSFMLFIWRHTSNLEQSKSYLSIILGESYRQNLNRKRCRKGD